jgi:hypothetical protein
MIAGTMRPLLALLLALAPAAASAQHGTGSERSHTFFGGPLFRVTSIADQGALMLGGRPGLLVNDRWGLGLTVLGWGTSSARGSDGVAYDLQMGYGGATLEWAAQPNAAFHLVGELTAAFGLLTQNPPRASGGRNDGFVVIEPAAAVEANVGRSLKVATGLSYRAVSGVGLPAFSDDDFSGPAVILTFKFGRFDR